MGRKGQEYEVESIIGKRRKKETGSVQYRVLWKGWSRDDATWEPEEHLENVREMIDVFNRKLEQRNSPRVSPSNAGQLKKVSEQIANLNIEEKKPPAQRLTRKTAKESDDEIQEDDEPETEQPRSPTISANRGRSQKIQEEIPVKPQQKKSLSPPPVKNGTKSINNVPETKRVIEKSMENEDEGTDDEQERNSILEVTGMYIGENGKYEYTVIEKKINRRLILKRSEVLKRDPTALVKFYESHLNTST